MRKRLRESTFQDFVPVKEVQSGKPQYPPDHLAGMAVPKGGSNCENCEYLKDPKKKICGSKFFIAWRGPNKPAGSNKIPGEIDSYCSDWWMPKKNDS